MTLPNWIEELDTLERECNLPTEHEAFDTAARKMVRPLLDSYLNMREAVEKAPHEKHCQYVPYEQGSLWLKAREGPCICWKKEALAWQPTNKEGV